MLAASRTYCGQIDLERRAERLRKREEKVARREADVELRQQTAARLAEKVSTSMTGGSARKVD
jgi:hypothetical protein